MLTEDEIGKGYEVSKDRVIPITDEYLAELPLPTAKAIEIVAFIPADQVDTVQHGAGSYYLTADGPVASKPYVLLRETLDRNVKVAVAKSALCGRERLGLQRPLGDALLLSSLRPPASTGATRSAPPPSSPRPRPS